MKDVRFKIGNENIKVEKSIKNFDYSKINHNL